MTHSTKHYKGYSDPISSAATTTDGNLISLVIPCYNEAANLPLLLDRCKRLASQGSFEIILVNNGSTDNSAAVLERLLPSYTDCRSIHVPVNQGYGFGILAGLQVATGSILGWTHADMQTDPNDALAGVRFFEKYGEDIYVKGRRIKRPISDNIFTVGMSIFESVLLRTTLWDINAQPNFFSRAFFESWKNPPHDFSLDLFVYFLAKHKGLKVYRFPVFFGKRAYGASHWNVNWAAKMKFIRRTIDFSFELKKRLTK